MFTFKQSLMWFFLTFVDFILKKVFHDCLKENAVPICPDTELSWLRTVFFNGSEMSWCRTIVTTPAILATRYLQGSENGRIVTIGCRTVLFPAQPEACACNLHFCYIFPT